MNKKILVTGGAGLIGLTLIKKLVDLGHSVICFDLAEQLLRQEEVLQEIKASGDLQLVPGTIMDKWGLTSVMQDCDAVFHLAAMLGVKRTEDNRLRCMDININGTDSVLQACVQNRVEHVIIASSSEVYGEPSHNPIKETDETKGKTVYAVSKLAAEELTIGYNQIHKDLNYTIVRFFNTYGERQVAQFVLSRFVKRVLNVENPLVYGDGKQTRSFCHVDDSTDGLIRILDNPIARNKTYNIGNSNEVYSLTEAAQKTIDTLAQNKGLFVELVEFDESDRVSDREIHHRYCDTSLAQKELGYTAKVNLTEGIQRIADMNSIPDDWAHRF